MQLGGTINDKKKTGRPTSWTPARKNQLKRLTNKVRGSQFGLLYKRTLRETFAFFHPLGITFVPKNINPPKLSKFEN